MSDPYKFEGHSPYTPKRIPYAVCMNCGLIYLNNRFTAWAIKMGCNYKDHPAYANAPRRFSEFNK